MLDEAIQLAKSLASNFLIYFIGGWLLMHHFWYALLLAVLVTLCWLAEYGRGTILIAIGVAVLVAGVVRASGAIGY